MLIVATVLKSGGIYLPQHVYDLKDQVALHLSLPHHFICLSDVSLKCDTIDLVHGWKGWWSKIELFRPGMFNWPVLYFDLDTRIVGCLDDLALGHRFTVLENFWSTERIGSGVMAWDIDLSHLYYKFMKSPFQYMRDYVITNKWGDQGFIFHNSPVPLELWQIKHPGRIVSFKRHCIPAGKIPDGASVVAFHGDPRPWAINERQESWFNVGKVHARFPLEA